MRCHLLLAGGIVFLVGCGGWHIGGLGKAAPPKRDSAATDEPVGSLTPTARIRPDCPIRIGGVYTLGLSVAGGEMEDSAAKGVKLSDANRDWMAAHCDMAALSPNTLAPDTFPILRKKQPLFTPLLYLLASTLYEQPNRKGSVGGWQPSMSAWTLRDRSGKEVPHPDAGAHWMDFGDVRWAAHWRKQTDSLMRQFGAHGAVAAEMPQGNTFVGEDLAKYTTPEDRGKATEDWLRAVHDPSKFYLLPSSLGFEQPVGRSTPAIPPGAAEPGLPGRYWDQFYTLLDGAWSEGWVHPYWSEETLPDIYWELHMEAAERAARTEQVFIVSTAYRDDDELEYALASYLLVAKRQARLAFQPMPLRPGQPANAGLSLAVLRRELTDKAAYFDAPLGVALQDRHQISISGGAVWRRAYQFGDVYVNSNDRTEAVVKLGGPMLNPRGQTVQSFTLLPHTGAILHYPPNKKK